MSEFIRKRGWGGGGYRLGMSVLNLKVNMESAWHVLRIRIRSEPELFGMVVAGAGPGILFWIRDKIRPF